MYIVYYIVLKINKAPFTAICIELARGGSVQYLCDSVLPSAVTISSPAAAADMIESRGGTFECVVTGGNPRPAVTWLLNNKRHTAVEYVSLKWKSVKRIFFLLQGFQNINRVSVETPTQFVRQILFALDFFCQKRLSRDFNFPVCIFFEN